MLNPKNLAPHAELPKNSYDALDEKKATNDSGKDIIMVIQSAFFSLMLFINCALTLNHTSM